MRYQGAGSSPPVKARQETPEPEIPGPPPAPMPPPPAPLPPTISGAPAPLSPRSTGLADSLGSVQLKKAAPQESHDKRGELLAAIRAGKSLKKVVCVSKGEDSRFDVMFRKRTRRKKSHRWTWMIKTC